MISSDYFVCVARSCDELTVQFYRFRRKWWDVFKSILHFSSDSRTTGGCVLFFCGGKRFALRSGFIFSNKICPVHFHYSNLGEDSECTLDNHNISLTCVLKHLKRVVEMHCSHQSFDHALNRSAKLLRIKWISLNCIQPHGVSFLIILLEIARM